MLLATALALGLLGSLEETAAAGLALGYREWLEPSVDAADTSRRWRCGASLDFHGGQSR
jgi:hypothetical protein